MKVVLAFDKFKGSVTSRQLNEAAQDSLCGLDDVTTVCIPVADGGDGTVEVLATSRQGQWVTSPTMGPLLQLPPVMANYYLCDDGTALIEVAAASGLALLPTDARDVMRATTLGTGMLMRDAMERGARHIVLGLGGSATCDAGMGIMCALGAEFLDADGHHLYPSGESLEQIAGIETRGIPQTALDCRYTLLTDVDNPLCGNLGTAHIYAPQKGASPEQVEAAGGIPALMMHLLPCELLPGGPYVLSQVGLEEALDGADLVITGEGRFDRQTLMGKGPGCVISMAREHGIPVAVICGLTANDFDPVSAGLERVIAVSDGLPHDEAMDPESTLRRVSQAVLSLLK